MNRLWKFFFIGLLTWGIIKGVKYLVDNDDKNQEQLDAELINLPDSPNFPNGTKVQVIDGKIVKSSSVKASDDLSLQTTNFQNTNSGITPLVQTPIISRLILPLFTANQLKSSSLAIPKTLSTLEKSVKSGVLINVTDKTLLWQKNSAKPVPIASMTKMMTGLLVLEAIKSGKVSLSNNYRVTADCTKVEPTRLGITKDEVISLENLMLATMIKSANDAAYMVGEIICGTPEKFVRLMNIRAKQYSLSSCIFYNMNGLPEGPKRLNNLGSAMDMARLASILLQYPDAMRWSSTKLVNFTTSRNHYQIINHNRILNMNIGATGMKTGYTLAAKHCVTVTSENNGKKYIMVVTGMDKAGRDAFVKNMLELTYKSKK